MAVPVDRNWQTVPRRFNFGALASLRDVDLLDGHVVVVHLATYVACL